MTNTVNVNLVQQIQDDYLAYSLSVIVGRAFPRYTDGCKSISRRIVTAMKWLNLKPDGRYMKSARVEGEVMGKLSPHGGSYSSIVTLAAPWNNMAPLVDGHGNWGSSTDSAASSRYTECKLSPFAWDCLLDDSETWKTMPNYDGTLQEPIELNAKIPYVLLNGQEGIGVGYACKIASHSLRSIVEATKLVCKEAITFEARAENLRKAREVLFPDFPTGTQIVKDDQLEQYSLTGIGSIRCMAKVEIGTQTRSGKAKDRPSLTFTNLPPGTNPEKIGEQVKNEVERGRVEGVAEVNDLSDLTGDCVQIVAKPGVSPEKLRDQLYAYTDLDSKFSARTLVIDGTKPIELSPVEIVEKWVTWRLGRLQVKFENELEHREARLEIVQGLLKAIDKMDLIIKRIRAAKDKSEAKVALTTAPLKFSDKQAEAILDMRLRQLTNLDQNDLIVEDNYLQGRIQELKRLSSDETSGTTARQVYMLNELTEIGKRHGEARRSPLIDPPTGGVTRAPGESVKRPAAAPKPRFLKIDSKKGTVEQVKGPRGALVVDPKDKVILMTEDGTLKKVPATFKGVISTAYSAVCLAKKESEVSLKKYLVVLELDGQLKALTLSGEDLCKVTSKGKRWLPEGSTLRHFGEGCFTLDWVSTRKKATKLDLSVKLGKPGGKGIKVASIDEVKLP
jgi:DNA gyrase subunit A